MDSKDDKYNIFKKISGERECPLCHQYFKNRGFGEHHRHCKMRNGDWSKPKVVRGPYLCKFCNKEWDSRDARNGHQIKCKLNPAREECIKKISETMEGHEVPDDVKAKISTGMKKYQEEKRQLGEGIVGKTTIKNKEDEADGLDLFFKDEL